MSMNKAHNNLDLYKIDLLSPAREAVHVGTRDDGPDNRHFVSHQALSVRARRLLEPTREFNQQVFKKFLNDWSQVFQRTQPARPYSLPVTMAK